MKKQTRSAKGPGDELEPPSSALISVIIPAHNEATIIAGTIASILRDDLEAHIDVIVAANGCTDDTADAARRCSPQVRVVEIDEASKPAALNAGDDASEVFPRIYVDADVKISSEAIFSLASALTSGSVLAAAPQMEVDLSRSNWLVKEYYRIWALTDYRQGILIGAGVYGVSEVGRERWGLFPDIVADDRFVQLQFDDFECQVLSEHTFTIRAPASLRSQVRRVTRVQVGNAQLGRLFPELKGGSAPATNLIRSVAAHPRLYPGFVVYAATKLWVRFRARGILKSGKKIAWHKDATSR